MLKDFLPSYNLTLDNLEDFSKEIEVKLNQAFYDICNKRVNNFAPYFSLEDPDYVSNQKLVDYKFKINAFLSNLIVILKAAHSFKNYPSVLSSFVKGVEKDFPHYYLLISLSKEINRDILLKRLEEYLLK